MLYIYKGKATEELEPCKVYDVLFLNPPNEKSLPWVVSVDIGVRTFPLYVELHYDTPEAFESDWRELETDGNRQWPNPRSTACCEAI